MFLGSCCSKEAGFLSEPSSEDETSAYLDSLRLAKPTVTTYVECYHKEKRTRTKRDSNGNTRTETYYVEVVTWRGSEAYEIPYWTDTSEHTPFFTSTSATRLTLPEVVHFVDDESRQHYEAQRRAFIDANKYRDKRIRYHTQTNIKKYK